MQRMALEVVETGVDSKMKSDPVFDVMLSNYSSEYRKLLKERDIQEKECTEIWSSKVAEIAVYLLLVISCMALLLTENFWLLVPTGALLFVLQFVMKERLKAESQRAASLSTVGIRRIALERSVEKYLAEGDKLDRQISLLIEMAKDTLDERSLLKNKFAGAVGTVGISVICSFLPTMFESFFGKEFIQTHLSQCISFVLIVFGVVIFIFLTIEELDGRDCESFVKALYEYRFEELFCQGRKDARSPSMRK